MKIWDYWTKVGKAETTAIVNLLNYNRWENLSWKARIREKKNKNCLLENLMFNKKKRIDWKQENMIFLNFTDFFIFPLLFSSLQINYQYNDLNYFLICFIWFSFLLSCIWRFSFFIWKFNKKLVGCKKKCDF